MSTVNPTPAAVDTGPDTDDIDQRRGDPGEPLRWEIVALRVCMVAAITPIIVAAVRNGLDGWTPTLDAAATTTRVRDVFSSNFPLVGMWSAGSTWSGYTIHFPGAIQLYLLAIPVRLLGNSWGVMVGMAALNSAWILTAGWLIRRRVGVRGAILGHVFLTLFVWTLGSEIVVDITPMQMVTIPFAVFLIAVWSVADGDTGAIPVLALVANYLLLAHLAFTFLVPVIGLCAVVGLVLTTRRRWRARPETRPAARRHLGDMLGWSVVITVVLWTIPVIQQIFGEIPNITNLVRSSQVDRPSTGTYPTAAQAVASIVLEPPFWLRTSFLKPTFGHDPIGGWLAVGALITVATMVGLAVLAHRRGEHTVKWGLIVSGVAALASVENIVQAPNIYGFRPEYLRSLWGMAMFCWFVVALALWRLVATSELRARLTPALVVGVLLVAGLAVPHRNFRAGTSDKSVPLARAMTAEVVPAVRDKGTVRVEATGEFDAFTYWSALILALNTAGVPYCVPDSDVPQFGPAHRCTDGGDYLVTVRVGPVPDVPTGTLLSRQSTLTEADLARHARLRARVEAWLGTQEALEPTPALRRIFEQQFGDRTQEILDRYLKPTRGPLTTMIDSRDWIALIAQHTTTVDGKVTVPFLTPGIDPAVIAEWAELEQQTRVGLLTVWGQPVVGEH